jgi:hypothetical protein
MELKTLTWNIGGGKLLPDGADSLRAASYVENGLALKAKRERTAALRLIIRR